MNIDGQVRNERCLREPCNCLVINRRVTFCRSNAAKFSCPSAAVSRVNLVSGMNPGNPLSQFKRDNFGAAVYSARANRCPVDFNDLQH